MSGLITNENVITELKTLYKKNHSLLLPEAVVEAARDRKSYLHDQFEWDNTKAAEAYRIEQARELLRVVVEYVENTKGSKLPMRVFVSLSTDRENGGYRTTADVFSNKERSAQMLADALDELNAFTRKYKELKELEEVFEAIKKVSMKKAA